MLVGPPQKPLFSPSVSPSGLPVPLLPGLDAASFVHQETSAPGVQLRVGPLLVFSPSLVPLRPVRRRGTFCASFRSARRPGACCSLPSFAGTFCRTASFSRLIDVLLITTIISFSPAFVGCWRFARPLPQMCDASLWDKHVFPVSVALKAYRCRKQLLC